MGSFTQKVKCGEFRTKEKNRKSPQINMRRGKVLCGPPRLKGDIPSSLWRNKWQKILPELDPKVRTHFFASLDIYFAAARVEGLGTERGDILEDMRTRGGKGEQKSTKLFCHHDLFVLCTQQNGRGVLFCLVPSLTSNNISKGRRRGGSPSTLSWSVALSAVHYSLEGSEEEEEEGASLSGRGSATFVRSKRGGTPKRGKRERERRTN